MKPIVYSLQFRGQATPLGSGLLRIDLTAPSSSFVTAVSALGVRGRFDDVLGGEAVLQSEARLEDGPPLVDQGWIEFGYGNSLRFRGIGGRLAPSPDPSLRHGAVILEVEGGEGQFALAEGLITSNFLLSETGEVTQNHLGLIFIRDENDS
jgi:hypothetical protein